LYSKRIESSIKEITEKSESKKMEVSRCWAPEEAIVVSIKANIFTADHANTGCNAAAAAAARRRPRIVLLSLPVFMGTQNARKNTFTSNEDRDASSVNMVNHDSSFLRPTVKSP